MKIMLMLINSRTVNPISVTEYIIAENDIGFNWSRHGKSDDSNITIKIFDIC